MDALQLAQLSALFAGQGMQGTAYNPGQAATMKYLLDSGQGAIRAEAQKKAEKKKEEQEKAGMWGKAAGLAANFIPVAGPFVSPMVEAGVTDLAGGQADYGAAAIQGAMGGTMSMAGGTKGSSGMKSDVPAAATPPAPDAPQAPAASSTAPGGDGGGSMGEAGTAAGFAGAALGGMKGRNDAYTQAGGVSKPQGQPARTSQQGPREQMMNPYEDFSQMGAGAFKKYARTDPGATENIRNYLEAGNSLSPDQTRRLTRTQKKDFRGAGYEGIPSKGTVFKDMASDALMGYLMGQYAYNSLGK